MNDIRVTFLPQNKTVTSVRGRTLLDIAKENAINIHYECDSLCSCGTCHVVIERGAENLSSVQDEETFHLQRQNLLSSHRLSCQAKVLGEVVVRVKK